MLISKYIIYLAILSIHVFKHSTKTKYSILLACFYSTSLFNKIFKIYIKHKSINNCHII